MSKYFDTKPGSLEEAVSAAQQAAIAISKKEKGEKPKNEEVELDEATMITGLTQKQAQNLIATANGVGIKGKLMNIKGKGISIQFSGKNAKEFVDAMSKFGMTTEGKVECPKCKGEGCDHCDNKGYHLNSEGKMDPVNKKALKKDFDDRKDKDIDNDGDVDDSDEFLHKRRKAVSKAIGEEISEERFKIMIETLTELSPELIRRALAKADKQTDKDGAAASKADARRKDKTTMPKAGSAADKADAKYRASKARSDRLRKGLGTAQDREAEKEYQAQLRKKQQNEEHSLIEKAAKHISNLWKEAAKVKEADEKRENEEEGGKTMTGKLMSKVKVAPASAEKEG